MFQSVNVLDKDESVRKSAGFEKLNKYGNSYEIRTLCELLNKDDEMVMNMNDQYATWHLIARKEEMNVQNKYYEIKNK